MKFQLGKIRFDFSRPYIMGIVNLTPDSFSDGGQYITRKEALHRVESLILAGADIIDIGAESSRPGAKPISEDEEIQRLDLIIPTVKQHFQIPISVDTSKSRVARYCLDFGVDIINDISSFSDPHMIETLIQYQATVVVMHMQNTPQSMQANPQYLDVVSEIYSYLSVKIEMAKKAGIDQIIVDPGIGFGKTLQHNLKILANLSRFQSLNVPILIGTSRKSFIDHLCHVNVEDRLPGSLISAMTSVQQGVQFLRVHDVAQTVQAVQVLEAICNMGGNV